MSLFDDLIEIASEAVDDLNAEPFRLVPMVWPTNGRGRRDPEREIVDGMGILDYRNEFVGLQQGNRSSGGERNDFRTQVYASLPSLSIDVRQLRGVMPRQNDQVSMRDGGERRLFSVTGAHPDGHGRIALKLAKMPLSAEEHN